MSTSRPAPAGDEALLHVSLDEKEWALVRSLRELTPSTVREKASELVGQLLAFVASPGCTAQQADGAPCETPKASCDECDRVLQVLGDLQARLKRG
jgi:hypothetical protein